MERKKGPRKERDDQRPSCRVRICRDPETGRAVVVRNNSCPPGFIEDFARAAEEHGLTIRLRDVDADDSDEKGKKKRDRRR